MGSILLILQIVVCTLLIVVVLFQRSDSDGLSGLSGGSGSGIMSSRSKANFFTRFTAFLALVFMVNSLLYSVLISRTGASSALDKIAEKSKSTVEKTVDAAAVKPADGTSDAKKAPASSPDAAGTDVNKDGQPAAPAPTVPLAN